MTHTPSPDDVAGWSLIDRYAAGRCSADEAATVEAWIARAPWTRQVVDAMRAVRVDPTADAAVEELRRVYERINSATRMAEASSVPTVAARRLWPTPRFMVAAATAAGVLLTAYLGLRTTHVQPGAEAPRVPRLVVHTRAMEIARVTLRDGTHVVVAPNSTLLESTPDAAAAAAPRRELVLTGEAYFTVAPSDHAPFVVRTGGVMTRVLGTAFAVRHYNNDRETRVVVTSGKVTVGVATAHDTVRPPSVVLAEGMVGRVTDSTATATATTTTDVTALTRWTDGHLVFHDTPVAEALRTLEQWYGYRFVITDSALARQHLSATFDYRRTDDMFGALKTLLDVTLSFNENVVTVYPRGGAKPPARDRRAVRDLMVHPQESEVGR